MLAAKRLLAGVPGRCLAGACLVVLVYAAFVVWSVGKEPRVTIVFVEHVTTIELIKTLICEPLGLKFCGT